MSTAPLLQIDSVTKRFPGVLALDGVGLTVRAGEIHALLGENGAGKSTLIKVLTGLYPPDSGRIVLAGEVVVPASPREAEALGISTVYQEVNLIPTLSVAENIMLGRQPTRFGLIDRRALRRAAVAALARLEVDCDPDVELGRLPVAHQQMVAIARALDLQARVLVLDEPTASLDQREVAELFGVLRALRSNGLGIVFVTHFLDQVYDLTDRITVLRNGARVGEYETAHLPRLELVSAMLGRSLASAGDRLGRSAHWRRPDAKRLLEVTGLGSSQTLAGVSFSLEQGEILGLAGLLGSGRTETLRALFGIDRREGGSVRFKETALASGRIREAIRLGLAFCSEDRKAEGIFPHLSVRENLIMALQARRGLWRALSREEQATLCGHYVKSLGIRAADLAMPISKLSGGNQQKVLLARWLALRPEVILLDEPTRGIDIGAREEIEALIRSLSENSLGVVLVSSEIDEVVRCCSRVVILRDRQSVGECTGSALDETTVMRAIAGGSA